MPVHAPPLSETDGLPPGALPPELARELQFDKHSAEIEARYRRCSAHWKPHLDRTRATILEAAGLCERRRTVVLFGAGLLHDIPLAELSRAFERVLLVDAFHSMACRARAGIFPNVTCWQADVTGTAGVLLHLRKTGGPLPRMESNLLCDDASVDLLVSVNLASQLGCAPAVLLKASHAESHIRAFQRFLVESHLSYLRRFPGHTALITDYAWSLRPAGQPDAEPERRWSVLHDVPLPGTGVRWDWNIAPAPEADPHRDYVAHVAAFPDWKAANRLVEL
jgi:hypothetical protein